MLSEQQKWEIIKARYAADDLAQAIGDATMPSFGGYRIRVAIGLSGCLVAADAARASAATKVRDDERS